MSNHELYDKINGRLAALGLGLAMLAIMQAVQMFHAEIVCGGI